CGREMPATAVALIRAVVEPRRGIVLGWVVLRAKILWRRFVRIGLALVLKLIHVFCNAWLNVFARGVNLFDMRANFVIFRVSVLAQGMDEFLRAAKRFTWENNWVAAFRRRWSVVAAVPVPVLAVAVTMIVVTMIVAFQIFKHVPDVQ